MSIISKFLASKWVTVLLIAALAAAGVYVYHQGRLVGSAGEQVKAQADLIEHQSAQLSELDRIIQEKEQALRNQLARTQKLQRQTRIQELAVMEAKKNADKALSECLSMRIADGMRFGPSTEDGDNQSEAGTDLDG